MSNVTSEVEPNTKYFATVAKGLEPLTIQELKLLGANNVQPGFGGVWFEGPKEILYLACLSLRTATRIFVPLREFSAKNKEMLYDQVRRMKWERLLNPEMTFSVECTIAGAKSVEKESQKRQDEGQLQATNDSPKAALHHSRFVALKIKDAIVDQLRMKQGARPNIDTKNPNLKIHAYLHNGKCSLSLDASGRSLHERGYRIQDSGAPLKETLAAALVDLSEWDLKTPFIDPMCGSGTLSLEAAIKALNIAPGLFRDRFGFMGWLDYSESLWSELVEKAQNKVKRRLDAPVLGFDQDRYAIAAAIENATRAGLNKSVHFEKRSIESLEPVAGKPAGVVILNPPYGERLGEVEELKGLYKLIGDLFKQRMKGYQGYIFTGNLELAKHVGLRSAKRMILYNGAIECRFLKYTLY